MQYFSVFTLVLGTVTRLGLTMLDPVRAILFTLVLGTVTGTILFTLVLDTVTGAILFTLVLGTVSRLGLTMLDPVREILFTLVLGTVTGTRIRFNIFILQYPYFTITFNTSDPVRVFFNKFNCLYR